MAKEIIDIGDYVLDYLKKNGDMGNYLERLVREGIVISDKSTNGDIIKAMFPHYDIEIEEHKGYVKIFYEDFYTTYPLRWWNAPYNDVRYEVR